MKKEKPIIEPPHKSRFYIKATEKRKFLQPKNTWSYTRVEIFDKEQNNKKIGEYIRNYGSLAENTFFPFKNKEGEWFALYSEKYYKTYVMSLPSCEKIAECTTDRSNCYDSSGFCPAEYYVPFVSSWLMDWGENYKKKDESDRYQLRWRDPELNGDIRDPYDKYGWHHLDIGFIYGCYWGGSYYIQLMDLSKIKEGKVIFSTPFDPYYLPRKVKHLKDVIEIDVCGETGNLYGMSVNGREYEFDNVTKKIIEDEDEEEQAD